MLNVFNVIPVIATVLPSKRRLQSDPLVGPFTKILQIEKRILRCTLVENIQVIMIISMKRLHIYLHVKLTLACNKTAKTPMQS